MTRLEKLREELDSFFFNNGIQDSDVLYVCPKGEMLRSDWQDEFCHGKNKIGQIFRYCRREQYSFSDIHVFKLI